MGISPVTCRLQSRTLRPEHYHCISRKQFNAPVFTQEEMNEQTRIAFFARASTTGSPPSQGCGALHLQTCWSPDVHPLFYDNGSLSSLSSCTMAMAPEILLRLPTIATLTLTEIFPEADDEAPVRMMISGPAVMARRLCWIKSQGRSALIPLKWVPEKIVTRISMRVEPIAC